MSTARVSTSPSEHGEPASAAPGPTGLSPVELDERAAQPVAVVSAQVSAADLPRFLGDAFGAVVETLGRQGLEPVGPPLGRFRPTGSGFDVSAGFGVARPVEPDGVVRADLLPAGPAASVLFRGPYAAVAQAYEAVQRWLDANGWEAAGAAWESYLDEPGVDLPRTLVTVPCRRRDAGSAGAPPRRGHEGGSR